MTSVPPIRLARTLDPALWDRLVDDLTPEPQYHRWDWLDLQSDVGGYVVDRYLVQSADRPIGVFPVARRSPRSLFGVGVPFPYLGPLVPASQLMGAVAALRAVQLRTGLLISRFQLGPFQSDDISAGLRAAGCDVVEDTTLLVDVSHRSLETLRANYSSLRRRDMRRAVRDGAAVRPARPGEIAELLPRVLQEAFVAHGRPSPYPADIGVEIERWAAGREDVGAFTVLVGNEPAGVQVVIGGGTTAAAWAGGSLRRFRDANPNVLLYDALLQWAVERGYPSVDLGGRVDDGVQRFKTAFGAAPHPYLFVESLVVPGALLGAGRRLRDRVRVRV